jgi:hypothetical protein
MQEYPTLCAAELLNGVLYMPLLSMLMHWQHATVL